MVIISDVIDILERLRFIKDVISRGEEKYRDSAYRTAIDKLSKLNENDEFRSDIVKVGKKMKAKFDEIAASGKLKELDDLESEYGAVVEMYEFLSKLYGFKPKSIKKLIDGISDLYNGNIPKITTRDLLELASEKKIKLSKPQKVSLKWSKSIVRTSDKLVTRKDAESALKLISSVIENFGVKGMRIFIAGSYQRGLDKLGDVDIMLYSESDDSGLFETVCDAVVSMPSVRDVLVRKSRNITILFEPVVSKEVQRLIQVDIKWFHSDEFIPAMIYMKGPRECNIALRKEARNRGFVLNQYGLYNNEQKKIKIESRKQLLEILGIDNPEMCPKE